MLREFTLFGVTVESYSFFTNLSIFSVFFLFIFLKKDLVGFSPFSSIALAHTPVKLRENPVVKWVYLFIEYSAVYGLISLVNGLVRPYLSLPFLGYKSNNFFGNIYIVPITMFILSFLFYFSYFKIMDCMSIATCFSLIFFKVACIMYGCCYGIQWDSSFFFNTKNHRPEVPTAMIECVCAIIIFLTLLIIRKRRKKFGYLYPAFILMYCGSRFISEFWRDDYSAVLGPLKGYQLMCIVGFVYGLVLLTVFVRKGQHIESFFERRQNVFLKICKIYP